jgi:hypothetical protein
LDIPAVSFFMDPKTMLRFAFKDDLALLILLDGNPKPVGAG